MSAEAAIDLLYDCLASARKTHADVPLAECVVLSEETAQRLHWLERQLNTLVVWLEGLLTDMESGLSLQQAGFDGLTELEEALLDAGCQILALQSMIREVKGRGR